MKGYEEKFLPKIRSEIFSTSPVKITEKQLNASRKRINWCLEFWLLLYSVLFHPMIIPSKTGGIVMMALGCLAVFWSPGEDVDGIRGVLGGFLYQAATLTYLPIGSIVQTFTVEKYVFLKEYSNKSYGILSYAISKSIVELPLEAVYALIFSLIVYFGFGLENDFEHFMIYYLALTMCSFSSISIGLLLAAAVPNEEAAVLMQILVVAPNLLLSGPPMIFHSLEPWVKPFTYLSPMRYAIEILTRNGFEGRTLKIENPIDTLDYNLNIWF